MRILSAPKKSSEPLDAPAILAQGFFHTSTRLQLTLKPHRSKCEHMQRSGRKPWYCRSPETRPRHRNKSLQAQVGLMWCLGLVLTSAEEWVIPTASWRVSLPAGTHEILSTTAGGYLQPGWLFSVTQYSRWSNVHEWYCLLSVWKVIHWPSLCNCKALGTEGKMETRHLFGPSSPHPPGTYTTQSNSGAALPAKFR